MESQWRRTTDNTGNNETMNSTMDAKIKQFLDELNAMSGNNDKNINKKNEVENEDFQAPKNSKIKALQNIDLD